MTDDPSVIEVLPYLGPDGSLDGVLASLAPCGANEAACQQAFFTAALAAGALPLYVLEEATQALAHPAVVVMSAEADCNGTRAARLSFSEPVMNLQGAPLSAPDLRITIDGAVAGDAELSQLETGVYAVRFGRSFAGGELLVLEVPAQRLVGPLYGLVPATTRTVQLHDCVSPDMQARTVGSDELPFAQAPTGSDGFKVPLNTLFLEFSEPVTGSTPDGVVGADFLVEVSAAPTVNETGTFYADPPTYTPVVTDTIALSFGGKTRRRLQAGLSVEALALELRGIVPAGGERVRITPLSVVDASGNQLTPVAYAVLGALGDERIVTESLAGITTPAAAGAGNVFQCSTLEAGLLILVSAMLAHAMLYGAGILLPYIARAEHVAQFGRAPPRKRYAPRWGPAAFAVTLVLCVALLPIVAFSQVPGFGYVGAFFPLWAMLAAIFVRFVRATHKTDATLRAKVAASLPAALAALHLLFGLAVCLVADYPETFASAGARAALTAVLGLGIVGVSARLLLASDASEPTAPRQLYRRALARHGVGLLLLVAVVLLSALRPDWRETCQDSWIWALLPLLCAVGLLLLQQLLQRLLPSCFKAPPPTTPTLVRNSLFSAELPFELEPEGDAQLMLQKVLDRALQEGRSLAEVADEMFNAQSSMPEMPEMVQTAIDEEFEARNGRAPMDDLESIAFLKGVVAEARAARIQTQELELLSVPEGVVEMAHRVLLESGADLPAADVSDTRALQALSEKLSLDIAGFESAGFESSKADADNTREALVLKRSVDDFLSAQKRIAELASSVALPKSIALAFEAEFAQRADGDAEQREPLEVLELVADVVDEFERQTMALEEEAAVSGSEHEAQSEEAAQLQRTGSNLSDLDVVFQTERGFDMLEESNGPDSTIERLSFRKTLSNDDLHGANLVPEKVKPAVDRQQSRYFPPEARRSVVFRSARRAAPILLSEEAKAQVKAAIAHMEEANRAQTNALAEASAAPRVYPEEGGGKSALVPALLLASCLVLTVVAGVLAGVLGSGTAAPSPGAAIGVSLGVAGLFAAVFLGYRLHRRHKNQKRKLLQEALKRSSRVRYSVAARPPPPPQPKAAPSSLKSLLVDRVTPVTRAPKSPAVPVTLSRVSSSDSITSQERATLVAAENDRLRARVNRVAESNSAGGSPPVKAKSPPPDFPPAPPTPSSPSPLEPLGRPPGGSSAASPSSSTASPSFTNRDRSKVLPADLASRMTVAKLLAGGASTSPLGGRGTALLPGRVFVTKVPRPQLPADSATKLPPTDSVTKVPQPQLPTEPDEAMHRDAPALPPGATSRAGPSKDAAGSSRDPLAGADSISHRAPPVAPGILPDKHRVAPRPRPDGPSSAGKLPGRLPPLNHKPARAPPTLDPIESPRSAAESPRSPRLTI